MFKKKIYHHFNQDEEYLNLIHQAQMHSDNPMEQIEYVREQKVSKKHELMFLIALTQMYLADHPTLSEPITFYPRGIEFMLRGLMDAVDHMQNDLPDGVYEYIYTQINNFLIKCIESAKQEIDQRKVYKKDTMPEKKLDIPLPGDRWRNLWNFQQHHLSENEREQLEQTWEAMKDTLDHLGPTWGMLLDKKQAPEELKRLVRDIDDVQKDMLSIFHRLTEMLEDPYQVQREQLKKMNTLRQKMNKEAE